VLAVTVGVGWSVAMVLAVIEKDELSDRGALLLYVLGGALVGGVVTWLGGRNNNNDGGQP
jgi:hypothetical protein